MTGKDFHAGAPLNIPYSAITLNLGRDRLKRIYEACRCPVGLENLAFSYSLEEVKRHGDFLDQLIEAVNGFIILDLHNLYCQVHNFSISFDDIIGLYPLDKVREIHISGGSWVHSHADAERRIRRDTHDDRVPAEVFRFLKRTLGKCPNLKYVVMEQLGTGLKTEKRKKHFYDDFLKMKNIIAESAQSLPDSPVNSFLPLAPLYLREVIEDENLYHQQQELSSILETANSFEEAAHLLGQSSLAHSDWKIEAWEPYMIETAIKIAQKWKK
jgi:hypothetical protein